MVEMQRTTPYRGLVAQQDGRRADGPRGTE